MVVVVGGGGISKKQTSKNKEKDFIKAGMASGAF